MALGKLGLKGKGWTEVILGLVVTQVKVTESEERENKISRELQLLVDAPTEHWSKRGGGYNMKSETQCYLT